MRRSPPSGPLGALHYVRSPGARPGGNQLMTIWAAGPAAARRGAVTCTVTAALSGAWQGRAGPGASGPAGRARCPDTIIGLASAEVFCGDAARERGWPRIIDGIRDWGDRTERGVADMENRNLGRGRV